jgi:hypothetical protein
VKFSKLLLSQLGIVEAPIMFQIYLKAWKISPWFRDLSWTNELREIVDYLMSSNPLALERKHQITLLIPCHPKDFDLLQHCIKGAEENIEDEIMEIVVVSPVDLDIREISSTIPIRLLLDADVVDEDLRKKIKSDFTSDQYTWVLQQIVKISAALKLNKQYLLVLDSDTILTQRRTFVGEESQLLSISYEYHPTYVQHYKEFMPQHAASGISFVTHHQLWRTEVIQEIWSGAKLSEWLAAANVLLPNSISEYHTYGTYLLNTYPGTICWGRWGNKPISKRAGTDLPINLALGAIPKWIRPNSVSVHDYS